MKTLRQFCPPRARVVGRDAVLDIAEGRVRSGVFLEDTYRTGGMRDLFREASRRAGTAENGHA